VPLALLTVMTALTLPAVYVLGGFSGTGAPSSDGTNLSPRVTAAPVPVGAAVVSFRVVVERRRARILWTSADAYPTRVTYRRSGDVVEVTRGDPGGPSTKDHEAVLDNLMPGSEYTVWVCLPDGTRTDGVLFRVPQVEGPPTAPTDVPSTATLAGLDRQVTAAFAAIRTGSSDEIQRSGSYLMSLKGDEAFSAVEPFLTSPNRLERLWAARALAHMDSTRAMARVVPLLADSYETVREAAVDIIGGCGEAATVDLVAPLATATLPDVRRAAAAALGRLPGPDALRLLFALASDSDLEVRLEAVTRLGRPPAAPYVPHIIRMMESAQVRRETYIEALGRIGSRVALPALKMQLGSGDPIVRGATLMALARIEQARAIPLLERFMRSSRLDIRLQAIDALGETNAPMAVRILGTVVAGATDTTRRRAIRSLGRLSGERARAMLLDLYGSSRPLDRADAVLALAEGAWSEDVPRMVAALDDEHPSVRSAACLALSWLGIPAAVAPIERLADGDRSQTVRDVAANSLTRLRGTDLLVLPLRRLSVDETGGLTTGAIANE